MRNLSKVGVDTICYDFMPVVNWTRTNLNYSWHDGAIALGFDYTAAVAFDLCIIEREGAAKDYTEEQVKVKDECPSVAISHQDFAIEISRLLQELERCRKTGPAGYHHKGACDSRVFHAGILPVRIWSCTTVPDKITFLFLGVPSLPTRAWTTTM